MSALPINNFAQCEPILAHAAYNVALDLHMAERTSSKNLCPARTNVRYGGHSSGQSSHVRSTLSHHILSHPPPTHLFKVPKSIAVATAINFSLLESIAVASRIDYRVPESIFHFWNRLPKSIAVATAIDFKVPKSIAVATAIGFPSGLWARFLEGLGWFWARLWEVLAGGVARSLA